MVAGGDCGDAQQGGPVHRMEVPTLTVGFKTLTSIRNLAQEERRPANLARGERPSFATRQISHPAIVVRQISSRG